MTTEAKNRELLLLFFEPDEMPDPAKKEEFLKNVMAGQLSRTARITLDRMLLIQVKYIRKTAWLAALMILLAAALITKGNPDSVLRISALTPLLAFVTEIETRRSYAYGMAELEMTTAFSLRSIRYARFMILGLFDLAVLSGISLLIRKYIAIIHCNKRDADTIMPASALSSDDDRRASPGTDCLRTKSSLWFGSPCPAHCGWN